MKRTNISVAAVALTLVVPCATIAAQSAQRFSIQGSALYASVSGEAYKGLNAGVGFEAQLRYNSTPWSIGVGVQRTSHEVEGFSQNANLTGVFVEPRYVIPAGNSYIAPYASARLAVLSQSLKIAGNSYSTSGTQVNAGGGLLVRINARVNLDFGATVGLINFGKLNAPGSGTSRDYGSGTNVVVRAGIAMGLGG